MPIQILSDNTVAQIAAGEVVERPASVVKELIENALDAGAKNIHVTIEEGGRKLIRISDDGSGILSAEVALAFTQHATSKIQSVDDLLTLHTLGFRGEALSTIAAVSRTNVTTRHRKEDLGTQMRIEGGDIAQHQPAGAPAGTVISIENLFYNTPARLKFLKKVATEKRHITTLITRYAMAYPDVRFTLEHDGREAFRSNGTGALGDVLVKAVGLENFRQMLEVERDEPPRENLPGLRVFGYVSLPDFSRSDRTNIALFVNGRWIQDSSLTYAVVQAYHMILTDGRYPVATLMLELSPQEVDVNVHPTKAEVRFQNPNAVFSALQRAVREVLVKSAGPGSARYAPTKDVDWGGMSFPQRSSTQTEFTVPEQVEQRARPSNTESFNTADDDDPTAIPVGPGMPLKPRTLPMLRVVGQVGAMYIIAEGPAGMYLIDQHAAHDRIIYEKLKEAFDGDETLPQREIKMCTLELTSKEARQFDQLITSFAQVGFTLERFGPNTYAVRAMPELLPGNNPLPVLKAILMDLLNQKNDQNTLERIIQHVSSHAAVKAGQVLAQDEMQSLIRQLERCEEPRSDPRGKPTLLHMSGDQIARELGH